MSENFLNSGVYILKSYFVKIKWRLHTSLGFSPFFDLEKQVALIHGSAYTRTFTVSSPCKSRIATKFPRM